MDKLSTFNNEELLEVYDKIQEEINHLNENIIIEEDEVEEVQQEEAPAEENTTEEANTEEESKRKRRIAAGGLQSIWWLRSLMNPFAHPKVAFQYISHRVLRWSITPVALFALIPLNLLLVVFDGHPIYCIIGVLQFLFYLSALIGHILKQIGHRNKLLYVPCYFMFMNLNVFLGIRYLMSHKSSGIWEKSRRA